MTMRVEFTDDPSDFWIVEFLDLLIIESDCGACGRPADWRDLEAIGVLL